MPEKEIIKAYRINQLMFDVMLFIFLGLLFGWIPALCGAILKFFGVQDITYYIFLQKPLPEKWHWLRWTPLGSIKKILTKNEVITQAIIGVIISVQYLFLTLSSNAKQNDGTSRLVKKEIYTYYPLWFCLKIDKITESDWLRAVHL